MNADGKDQTRLTHTPMGEYEPVWSPDGRRIAYLRDKTSAGGFITQQHVFTIRTDGRGARQLTRGANVDSDISWSPDGERIAFTRNSGNGEWGTIVVVDVRRGGERRLGSGFDPAWRPMP
jgi:TolB protein